jgi:hypothetical protein
LRITARQSLRLNLPLLISSARIARRKIVLRITFADYSIGE